MCVRIGLVLFAAAGIMVQSADGADCNSLARIQEFINKAWTILRRSNAAILKAMTDKKAARDSGAAIYIPRSLSLPSVEEELRSQLTPALMKVRCGRRSATAASETRIDSA